MCRFMLANNIVKFMQIFYASRKMKHYNSMLFSTGIELPADKRLVITTNLYKTMQFLTVLECKYVPFFPVRISSNDRIRISLGFLLR